MWALYGLAVLVLVSDIQTFGHGGGSEAHYRSFLQAGDDVLLFSPYRVVAGLCLVMFGATLGHILMRGGLLYEKQRSLRPSGRSYMSLSSLAGLASICLILRCAHVMISLLVLDGDIVQSSFVYSVLGRGHSGSNSNLLIVCSIFLLLGGVLSWLVPRDRGVVPTLFWLFIIALFISAFDVLSSGDARAFGGGMMLLAEIGFGAAIIGCATGLCWTFRWGLGVSYTGIRGGGAKGGRNAP